MPSLDDLHVTDTQGTTHALSDLCGQGPVLLVFYPRDGTRVCTAQLCEYRDRLPDFTALGVRVIGINPQSTTSHGSFASDHGLTFPLYSDPGGAVCQHFGAAAWWGTRRLVVLLDQHGDERWRLLTNPFSRPSADVLLAGVREALSNAES